MKFGSTLSLLITVFAAASFGSFLAFQALDEKNVTYKSGYIGYQDTIVFSYQGTYKDQSKCFEIDIVPPSYLGGVNDTVVFGNQLQAIKELLNERDRLLRK